jgi:hypothetical protein
MVWLVSHIQCALFLRQISPHRAAGEFNRFIQPGVPQASRLIITALGSINEHQHH